MNFIKNKLDFIDTEYDFENGSDNDLFKTSTGQIVDLENYTTLVDDKKGADIHKHIGNNIDNSIRDLVAHLKSKPKYKIRYEKLNAVVL